MQYTGNKHFLIYENKAYFIEDDSDLLIALCVEYPVCQKQGNSSQQCLDSYKAAIVEQEAIKKSNKNNPRNPKLKNMGNKACVDWGARGTRLEEQTKLCRSLVDNCVSENSINGPEAVAECISKISMISDVAPYFVTFLTIEEQNALIGKYPESTSMTNDEANLSLKQKGLSVCSGKATYSANTSEEEKENIERTCGEQIITCYEKHKNNDYKTTLDCMIPTVGMNNWNYMLHEIRGN